MPLSEPVERRHLHTRRVECRGYFRTDGLWDIEGHITDVKAYAHSSEHRGEMGPDDPVHDMWIRLTVDETYTIRAVEARTDFSPFRICPDITGNFQRLVGLRIGAGFHRAVRERVGGTQGCVHLVELLGPVATVAFQTIQADKSKELHAAWRQTAGIAEPARETGPRRKPHVLDTCHAWASDSDVVQRWLPEFYKPAKAG